MHMKRLLTFSLLLVSLLCSAQRRQELPEASNVTKGVLPNGISYYLVSNTGIKGYADFALIQQGMASDPRTREILASSEGFRKTSPYAYLASKGVGYTPEGYVSTEGNAAVFRFEAVPVHSPSVSDSTLLLLFNIMQESPAEQALIVCGDIDPQRCLQQIKTLSLSVPERTSLSEEDPYQFTPSESATAALTPNNTEDLALITVNYSRPRLPRESLSTSQPYLSQMFQEQLGEILSQRVKYFFRQQGIPVSYTSSTGIQSSETSADERWSFTVGTSASALMESVGLLSLTMADLDRKGAELRELHDAKGAISASSRRGGAVSWREENRRSVDKCIAAYLRGAAIVDDEAAARYLRSRNLDPEVELGIFNKYIAGILSPSLNVSIEVSAPAGVCRQISGEQIAQKFTDSWQPRYDAAAPVLQRVPFASPRGRAKIKSTLTDPVTGGEIWTYQNGFSVVYKYVPGSGTFNYSLALRGGLPLVPSIHPGESGFISDVLTLFDVHSMSPAAFQSSVNSEGISFVPRVGPADFRIDGAAPSAGVETLLGALTAYMKERRFNESEFEYYRSCETLRIEQDRMSPAGVKRAMEHILLKDSFLTGEKDILNLSPELPRKAENFLSTMFSKTDDGALIVIGDIDAASLKAALARYVGQFGTGRKAASRAKEIYSGDAGWGTRTVDAATSPLGDGSQSVNVLASAEYPVSIKSTMAFEIACEAVRIKLNRALASEGLYARVDFEEHYTPSERLCIYVTCRPCDPAGLPLGIEPSGSLKALAAVRSVMTALTLTEVSESLLDTSKKNIANKYASYAADPDFLLEASIKRNALGINMVTGYKSNLDSVNAADVRDILEAFDAGAKVEWIFK